jgi:hypothetical protein
MILSAGHDVNGLSGFEIEFYIWGSTGQASTKMIQEGCIPNSGGAFPLNCGEMAEPKLSVIDQENDTGFILKDMNLHHLHRLSTMKESVAFLRIGLASWWVWPVKNGEVSMECGCF